VTPLDREREAVYDVTVTCSDGGGKSSSYVVRVDVVDENDNEPVFSQDSPYEFELNENCGIGTTVGRVSVNDADTGQNGDVQLKLTGDEFILIRFAIDRLSGIITTRSEIDRESLVGVMTTVTGSGDGHVTLTVVASDGGSPVRSSSTVVLVHINDVNDERPLFDTEHYTFHIAENQPGGTIVGHVNAVDRDLPPNNHFRYLITDYRESETPFSTDLSSEYFDIDPVTGVISIRSSFDRERASEYRLNVIATSETSDIATIGHVTVRVDDVNDHRPMFITPLTDNKTRLVSSRAPRGHVVMILEAVDLDEPGSPNSALTYAILSGSDSMFTVNPRTGTLTVVGHLDDIILRDFMLRLIVTDAGKPFPLNDTTELRIIVSRDVAYVPFPVDADDVTSDEYRLGGYGGLLASETTAVFLAISLAAILTAIVIVAVTMCVVRRRNRSRRGILLVANGPRHSVVDCLGEKDKSRSRTKLTGKGRSPSDDQPRARQIDYTSTLADVIQQRCDHGGNDVTRGEIVAPLVNGAMTVTSLDIRHLQDSDFNSFQQQVRCLNKPYLLLSCW